MIARMQAAIVHQSTCDFRNILFKENWLNVPGIQVGVQLSSFGKPFRQAAQMAASFGVDAVEIDARRDLRPTEVSGTGLRQIRKILSDLNLRVVAVRFQTRRGYDCPEDLDRRVTATKEAMRMAADLGANVLVNQIGLVEETEEESSSRDTLRHVLSDLGRYSQHYGAFLGCETGSEPAHILANFLDLLPEASVGITFNPGNLIVNGFEIEQLERVAKHILLVHAKDGVRDRARGRGTEVPLGRGLAEFPLIAASLEERHFSGAFVIDRDPSPSAFADVKNSVEFLRNM
jgi:sugar phosphate isomerase/epimerase